MTKKQLKKYLKEQGINELADILDLVVYECERRGLFDILEYIRFEKINLIIKRINEK